jgi:hypothetical protein
MQCLPRFISTDADGNDEREFLPDSLSDVGEMLTMEFLKGYQWPFDVRKARDGSSRIDLLVHQEMQKGRRIFLDFRANPGNGEIDFSRLSPEAYAYLNNAGACFGTPIDRLLHMNEPAVDFYMDHGVDLRREPLEIALCVQHNNGGLAVDASWQTSIGGLYAAGEAAATHGVYRPGGSALNAGQCGAVRASEAVAAHPGEMPEEDAFLQVVQSAEARHAALAARLTDDPAALNVRRAYADACHDMDRLAGPVRSEEGLVELLQRIDARLADASPLGIHNPGDLRWAYRLRDTLLCQRVYVTAMLDYLKQGGKSRGSAMYIDPQGEGIPALPEKYRFRLDSDEHARVVQEIRWTGSDCAVTWRGVRPMPPEDESFERVWKAYRQRKGI